jgi:flagellar biosynthetic protein FliQ
MDPNLLLEISREAVMVLMKVSMPILILTLIVGVIVSLFQALTQVQEATLSFVPKIITVLITLTLFMPYMLSTLKVFAEHISEAIISIN